MSSRALDRILAAIRHLRPWPPAALRVLELSRQPEVVPSELVAVLETDAALTARILKLSNSAFYGFQEQVATLREAGNRLGNGTLVGLVMTTCIGREFSALGHGADSHGRQLWERSVMNALAAKFLAGVHGGVDRDEAYTAALLQNIGQLVIAQHLSDGLAYVTELRKAGVPALEAERRVFGLDHTRIGARLALRWAFPGRLVDTILHHHEPEKARENPPLVAIGHLAESITDAVALGEGLGDLAWELSEKSLGLVGFTSERLASLEDALIDELSLARGLIEAA